MKKEERCIKRRKGISMGRENEIEKEKRCIERKKERRK